MFQGVESPKSDEVCVDINSCIPPGDFEAFYYWDDMEFGTRLVWSKDQSVNMSLVRFNIYRGNNPDQMEKIATQVNVPYNYHYEFRDEGVLPGNYYYMVGANYGDDQECFTDIIAVTVTKVNEDKELLSIHPNPTHGNVTLNATGTTGMLRIVNSLGQTVLETQLSEEITLDLTPFGRGLFLIVLQTEQGHATQKVIVE